MVPLSVNISSIFGTAVISFVFTSVAICASTRRCSQPQALTMCEGNLQRFYTCETQLSEISISPANKRVRRRK